MFRSLFLKDGSSGDGDEQVAVRSCTRVEPALNIKGAGASFLAPRWQD